MNKALEILKEALELQDMGHAIEAKIREAIAELEEAMQPKNCDGCKWENINHLDCMDCKRNTVDRYEPKDTLCA